MSAIARFALAGLAGLLAAPGLAKGEPAHNQQQPVTVGLRKQLLVDDYVIEQMAGVRRELGQVTKANGGRPIFTEGWLYGTVLHDDVMNFYIATSRDADQWDLRWVYEGQPMIPRGPNGAFDKDLIQPASSIVTHDDRHWLYCAGGNERHGTEKVQFPRKHAIGLAWLRLDGFVALTAGDQPGTVLTRPFRLDGAKLQVNMDAAGGEFRVELLDETNQPLEDYSGEAAPNFQKIDALRFTPHWEGGKDLSQLQGRTVRLKFHLKNCRLYSFQVTGTAP